MNKVKLYREKLNYTQTELAEKAGLSLRTVQRIESGIKPKGFTLTALAHALDIDQSEILSDVPIEEATNKDELFKIKLLNLSALSFLIIPYGNIIFPFLIWRKNRNKRTIHTTGTRILNFQILWTLITSVLLLLCPLAHYKFSLNFPLILWICLLSFLINILVIVKNSVTLSREKTIKNQSPIEFI